MMFQNQRNMISPTTFVFHRIQRDIQTHLRDVFIMNVICTTQHKHGTMHENEAQTCKTCRIGIILRKPTKPIKQSQQNHNKTIFNNYIFKSQHKHKIQEI